MPYATCHVATLDNHGHAPTLERLFNAQLHCVSCKSEPVLNSGAGVSLICTDNNRPPCWCYPGSRDLGKIGSKTTSRDQTFACIYVLALCVPITHHGYVGVCLILVHVSVIWKIPPDVFTWVMWSHPGHNDVCKNSSQPLTTSVDCSAPENPASAESTVRKNGRNAVKLVPNCGSQRRAKSTTSVCWEYRQTINNMFLQFLQYVESCDYLLLWVCSHL